MFNKKTEAAEVPETPETPEAKAPDADVERRLQSEADKIRTKYAQELKAERARGADLEARAEAADLARQRAEAQAAAVANQSALHRTLAAEGLPLELADLVRLDSPEAVGKTVAALKRVFMDHRRTVSAELMKANGRIVQQANLAPSLTLAQIHAMDERQISANWPTVQRSLKSLGIASGGGR